MSKIKLPLSDLFGRLLKSQPTPPDLTQRVNRVAQSILENESLTGELDDTAAKELLDWGVACAKMIAQGTVDLNDDTEAEEAMSSRLRATRRLMRAVNRWITNQQEMDAESSANSLSTIIEQARVIYGEDFTPPDNDQCVAFSSQQTGLRDNPQQMIANLRDLIENTSLTSQGETND